MNQSNCRIRKAIDDDLPFIFNSWLKSYRFSHFGEKITNTIYFEDQHKVIDKILKTSEVYVACNIEDPSQLYGYIAVGEEEGVFVLHFIYVKHTFRNMGIGKTLLDAVGHDSSNASVYTHHTKVAEKLSSKYNFVFHPYLLFDLETFNESS